MSGKSIIKGMRDAVAYTKGDKSKDRLTCIIVHRDNSADTFCEAFRQHMESYEVGKHCREIEAEALKAKLAIAEKALEHYQAVDDGMVRLLAGFKATPDTVDENGIARKALTEIRKP